MVQSSSYFSNLYNLSFDPYMIKNTTWQSIKDGKEIFLNEEEQCSICIQSIANGGESEKSDKLVRLDCNPLSKEHQFHYYHYDCFAAIPNKNEMGCPTCKVGIYPSTISVYMKEVVALNELNNKKDRTLYLRAFRFAPLKSCIKDFLQSRFNRISASSINATHWILHWVSVAILVISCMRNRLGPVPSPLFTPRQIWNGTLPLQIEQPICSYKPIKNSEDRKVRRHNETMCKILHNPLKWQKIVSKRRQMLQSIEVKELFKITDDNIIRLEPLGEQMAKSDRIDGIDWAC